MSDTSGASDSGSGGYQGQQVVPGPAYSSFNRQAFGHDQAAGLIRTHIPVVIKAVNPNKTNPLGPPTVDAQILVKLMDGAGNVSSHGLLYELPIHRHQAGDFALVTDPVVGDIGTIAVQDRDISSLVANGGQESQPGSYRRFDLSDAVYHGQILNQPPKHYIQMQRDSSGNATSLNIVSTVDINLTTSANVVANKMSVDANGNITTPGNITAGSGTADSVTLQKHVHPGTPPPTPGT